jgi:hypothetical protein
MPISKNQTSDEINPISSEKLIYARNFLNINRQRKRRLEEDSPTFKYIHLLLILQSDEKQQVCISYAELEEYTSLTLNQVKNSIIKLIKLGYIKKVQKKGNKINTYEIRRLA